MTPADRLRVAALLGSEELAALEKEGFAVVRKLDAGVVATLAVAPTCAPGDVCPDCKGTGRRVATAKFLSPGRDRLATLVVDCECVKRAKEKPDDPR